MVGKVINKTNTIELFSKFYQYELFQWHLGFFTRDHIPTERGFDTHFGFLTGKNDYFSHTQNEVSAFQKIYMKGFFNLKICIYFHFLQKGEWGFDFQKNGEIHKPVFGQYTTEIFTNEAEFLIKNHNKSEVSRSLSIQNQTMLRILMPVHVFSFSFQPFFMYLAQQAVHNANSWRPLQAPYSYYEKFSFIKDKNRRTFAGKLSLQTNP